MDVEKPRATLLFCHRGTVAVGKQSPVDLRSSLSPPKGARVEVLLGAFMRCLLQEDSSLKS